jgi:signal-transduction protein with cAMP-binding, CBS, and nucleotidyltransferase domain
VLVDNGAAIISERDMTRALAAGLGRDIRVSEVATARLVTVPAEMSILDTAALMFNEEVGHLVVRSSETTRGVVSLRSVVAVLLQELNPSRG